MRVDFVGHATLLVRSGELSILTDPWWTSPAYRGQWYPYPVPVPEQYDLRALDAVYISHGHEDHLHRDTLRELLALAPNVEAIIPQRYDASMRDYLRRIGFARIREVASGTAVTLRKGQSSATLRILTHMDDSLLTIEAGGRVLVNANDALHASRRELIEEYCRVLRWRLPQIDYLFCGFGGASYFPNCIHAPGKDDAAIARERELFFLRNFALIAERLQPRHAVPFAAHFVLPGDQAWWISDSRLRMEAPTTSVRRLAPRLTARLHDLQPGDWIAGDEVHASPWPVLPPAEVKQTVEKRYGTPKTPPPLAETEFQQLVDAVRARASQRAAGQRLDAVLDLWDHPAAGIRIVLADGRAIVEAVDVTAALDGRPSPQIVFGTRSDLIRATMQSPFGRDLITIGYAADVRLRSADDVAANLQDQVLNVLAYPQPRWRERLRADPRRVLGFAVGDPSMRLQVKSRFGLAHRAPTPTAVADRERDLYRLGDWAALAQTPEDDE